MQFHSFFRLASVVVCLGLAAEAGFGQTPPPPRISLTLSNAQKKISWNPYPAVREYKILSSTNLGLGFFEDPSGIRGWDSLGYTWISTNISARGFYSFQATPMTSNALLTANVLNRLAYGPTPDELDRIITGPNAIGPQAYLDEQMAPEKIVETMDAASITQTTNGGNWVYVTATGAATTGILYIYLSGAGEAYIDDLKFVAGIVPETGVNLIKNGDFESVFPGNNWTFGTGMNLSGSLIDSSTYHSGTASLHLVSTGAGSTRESSIYQTNLAVTVNAAYTLSYWYLPGSNSSTLTVRLSGSGILSTPDTTVFGIYRRLNNALGSMSDLRAWFCQHAVSAKRQLLEVLTQFCENHFVTQYSKEQDYFGTYYDDGALQGRLATDLEFREITRWRHALMNPTNTFYDLLRISAESPAMIIYLDTVNSKGNDKNIANENYARELLELFTFGVDNGYDQNDIVQLSRCWTGWTLRLVDATNVFNPFAPQSTTIITGSTNTSTTTIANLAGVWAFNFKAANHNPSTKSLFFDRNTNGIILGPKLVPSRFGPPWAGRNYSLTLVNGSGTNGIQDGYQIISHLANQPFTEEFLSVKLCRLFVHDDFAIGYEFTDPNLSAEGQLVKQCMLAWENSIPKGSVRTVLNTIFNSDLFRSHGGSLQKVKTPLEFVASTIRSLQAANPNGTYTASTDGYALSSPMNRMGLMVLFDRAEPDGYPETAPGWISAGTLAERLRFVQSVLMASGQTGKDDAGANNLTDPVALVKLKLSSASWVNAGAVADYFIGILYPGEGKANLDLYRNTAVNFLNNANDGVTPSPFSNLSMAGNPSPYDTRVRGLVAMLMTFQRFQEQ